MKHLITGLFLIFLFASQGQNQNVDKSIVEATSKQNSVNVTITEDIRKIEIKPSSI